MISRSITAGATIEDTYLAVPGHYGIGKRFPNTDEGWADAVDFAQAKKADLVDSLTKSLGSFGTPESIERGANRQVRIDLRWVIRYSPDAFPGGTTDTTVESFTEVDALRARVIQR